MAGQLVAASREVVLCPTDAAAPRWLLVRGTPKLMCAYAWCNTGHTAGFRVFWGMGRVLSFLVAAGVAGRVGLRPHSAGEVCENTATVFLHASGCMMWLILCVGLLFFAGAAVSVYSAWRLRCCCSDGQAAGQGRGAVPLASPPGGCSTKQLMESHIL